MPLERVVITLVVLAAMALFAFQLWSVLRSGHVRWRVQKIHRHRRPIAFWFEVTACVIGLLLFAGLLFANLVQ